MIHYFDRERMAYTACKRLMANCKLAADNTVDCPECLLALTPQQVNNILARLGPEEAFNFLGTLGHIRGAKVYSGA